MVAVGVVGNLMKKTYPFEQSRDKTPAGDKTRFGSKARPPNISQPSWTTPRPTNRKTSSVWSC
jgi:hypothetical protein